jgi:hypothetical protein
MKVYLQILLDFQFNIKGFVSFNYLRLPNPLKWHHTTSGSPDMAPPPQLKVVRMGERRLSFQCKFVEICLPPSRKSREIFEKRCSWKSKLISRELPYPLHCLTIIRTSLKDYAESVSICRLFIDNGPLNVEISGVRFVY